MVRAIFAMILSAHMLFGTNFDRACLACHRKRAILLKPIFFEYLLYYSSKRGVLAATKAYLLHPDPKKRLYKKGPIYHHAFTPQELDSLLEEYWERYKVIGKIK